MKILMVSAEMAPFAKVGGLGDVVDALSRALAARGHDVRVVLPLYQDLDRRREGIRPYRKLPRLSVRINQRIYDFQWHLRGSASARVKVYLVECAELFGRPGIYTDGQGEGFPDVLQRASLHAQAALMLPSLLDWPVDIVHGHDAEAAPALVYRNRWYAGRKLPGPAATVLTIHNLAHQETHSAGAAVALGLPASLAAYPGLLEYHGGLNLLKGGILAADQVNTVSATYAGETMAGPETGCGLDGVLRGRREDYRGILNGGDYESWDPARDKVLPANFSAADRAGKIKCRRSLLRKLGLKPAVDKPVCGFVGRLVHQKGIDLLLPILGRLAGDGFAFALLGTGDRELEKSLAAVAARYPDRVAFVGEYSDKLARLIYAGSDLFLMPSLFEPCGLSQMYALRYGTPPVVRRTGGLADTVIDADQPQGTGFVFDAAAPAEFLAALRRAESLFADAAAWSALVDRGMAVAFSWDDAAAGYEKMYRRALVRRRQTVGGLQSEE